MARFPILLALCCSQAAYAGACVAQVGMDCYGEDIGGGVKNISSVMTEQVCCSLCAADPKCKVAVFIPKFPGEPGISSCGLKSGCAKPQPFPNRVKLCQPGDHSCPLPPPAPPMYPCACSTCPCPKGEVLPRTCDAGSVAAKLPFCDHTAPLATRMHDLVNRLTREEKINLVTQADTGFLPRLNLKEFNFFNTCLHGWCVCIGTVAAALMR